MVSSFKKTFKPRKSTAEEGELRTAEGTNTESGHDESMVLFNLLPRLSKPV